jgi:hypothetical protein
MKRPIRRLVAMLLDHRCSRCLGEGIECPKCLDTGFICWRCGRPAQGIMEDGRLVEVRCFCTHGFMCIDCRGPVTETVFGWHDRVFYCEKCDRIENPRDGHPR